MNRLTGTTAKTQSEAVYKIKMKVIDKTTDKVYQYTVGSNIPKEDIMINNRTIYGIKHQLQKLGIRVCVHIQKHHNLGCRCEAYCIFQFR